MARIELGLYAPQIAFRNSQKIYRGFVGGVGSGKSWIGAYDLLRRAKPGRLYMVAAPTYRMLDDASWRVLKELSVKLNFLSNENKSDMRMTLGNSAEILGRSTEDPDRLKGPNLSGFWLDEASQMKRDAFDYAIGRLREGGEQGWLSATFTPKGKSHWTYKVFAAESPTVALFHAKTSENPFLHKDFARTVEQQYSPQLARQELAGEFIAMEGAEFPASWFEDEIWFDNWPNDVACKIMALDPSKGKKESRMQSQRAPLGDYSAIIKLMIDTSGTCWVEADLGRFDPKTLVDVSLGHYRTFWPDSFSVETNQFQTLLASEIHRVGREHGLSIPIAEIVNTRPKVERIRRITPFLSRKELRFKDTPTTRLLVEQLMDFPLGSFDDGPDALDMALQEGLRMLAGGDIIAEHIY